MSPRTHAPTAGQVVTALVNGPYLKALSEHLADVRPGRRRKHPAWVVFAYAAMCRHFRSSNHTDAELRGGLWDTLRAEACAAGLDDPGTQPYQYWHHQYWRDRVALDDATRDAVLTTFTATALDQAHHAGLLLPTSGGSLTRPTPARTIYGDGTVVRPIFRPVTDTTQDARQDPSAEEHHRHDGPIHGNNFVMFSIRADTPASRIILGIARVPAPGREADTAVELLGRIHRQNGPGIQAVVYDGAFQGTHLDQIMRRDGLIVVNRPAAATRNADGTATPKQRPLGTVTHTTRRGDCSHVLHTRNGQVVEVTIADDREPVIIDTTRRKQIRRVQRADGTYRFHLGIQITCPHGDWTTWLSPHAEHNRDTRPEQLRLIPPDDPHFPTLYGLRNDAESLNSQYKRSLLTDRAASIGWQRQTLDLLAYAIAHNSQSHTSSTQRQAA